jgi:site-specific DNA recombinase
VGSDALASLHLDAHTLDAGLHKACALSERWLAAPPVEMKSLVRDIVEQITVAVDRIDIRLSRTKIAAALQVGGGGQRPDLDPVVRRAGKGKRLVIANDAGTEAFMIRNQLLAGSDASVEAMSERLGIAKGRLTSLVRLSYLAPGIVRALLAVHKPIELTPTRLLRLSKNLPQDWKEQRRFLGFAA